MNKSNQLPRCVPEKVGVDSRAIMAFIDCARDEELELHSLMVLRHGYVIAEGWWKPYQRERRHLIYSVSKSFTSTAVGFAVQEGRLSVDDQVISFFPDNVTDESKSNMKDLKIRHLLSMSTGHSVDTTPRMRESENWVQAFLDTPIDHEPGSHFLYNTGASYMLSAIVQGVTGQTLLEYLEPRLIQPLGIENPTWRSSPQGVNAGGFGMSIRTEDMAKFGQLYLQKGMWNGERILSEAWIDEATCKHVSNGNDENSDWAQGYGYQFWKCRYGAYRGDGAFGQFCVVLPEQNAVFITTAGVMDMQAILNLLWKHIIPSMSSEGQTHADNSAALKKMTECLEITKPNGLAESVLSPSVSEKVYLLEENTSGLKSVKFQFDSDMCVLTMWDEHGAQNVTCGIGSWAEGDLTVAGTSVKVSATGSWRTSSMFVMKWSLVELPFTDTVTCQFVGDSVRMLVSRNTWLGPLSNEGLLPTLTGAVVRDRDA